MWKVISQKSKHDLWIYFILKLNMFHQFTIFSVNDIFWLLSKKKIESINFINIDELFRYLITENLFHLFSWSLSSIHLFSYFALSCYFSFSYPFYQYYAYIFPSLSISLPRFIFLELGIKILTYLINNILNDF